MGIPSEAYQWLTLHTRGKIMFCVKRLYSAALCIAPLLAITLATGDAGAVTLKVDPALSSVHSVTSVNGVPTESVDFPITGNIEVVVAPEIKDRKTGQTISRAMLQLKNIDVNLNNGAGKAWTFPDGNSLFSPPLITNFDYCYNLICLPTYDALTYHGHYDGRTLTLTGDSSVIVVSDTPATSYSYTLIARRAVDSLVVSLKPSGEADPVKVPVRGGQRRFTVTLSDTENPADVVPVVVSGGAEWITITKAPATVKLVNGSAKVDISYAVEKNEGASSREATVTVNGTPVFSIKQAGAPCNIKLSSNQSILEFYGGTRTVTYTVPEGCTVTATANNDWLSVSPGDHSFAATVDETREGRTGQIMVTAKHPETEATNKKIHTVAQRKRSSAGTVRFGRHTQINTPEEARKAAAAALFIYAETDTVMSNLSDVSHSFVVPSQAPLRVLAMTVAKLNPLRQFSAEARSATRECADGGSVTWSNYGNVTTFKNCREYGFEKNGTIRRSRTMNAENTQGKAKIIVGTSASSPFSITKFSDATYAQQEELFVTSATVALTLKRIPAEEHVGITFDGRVDSTIFARDDEQKSLLDMKKFRLSIRTNNTTSTFEADGSLRTTSFTNGVMAKVQEVSMKDLLVASDPPGEGNQKVLLSGSFAINSYPDSSCIDGTFAVETVTPMTYAAETGTTGGSIVVNGVAVAIDKDGFGTATLNGIGHPVGSVSTACTP